MVTLTTERQALLRGYTTAQMQIRARALRDALTFMRTVDPDRFDDTWPDTVAPIVDVVTDRHATSQTLAGAYHQTDRRLAGHGRLPELPDPPPIDRRRIVESLRITGLVGFRTARRGGRDPSKAYEIALVRQAGAIGRHVLSGGRDYTVELAAADPRSGRWYRHPRRAKPCAFCAMMAARGAVFTSEAAADFTAHDNCWCVPKPMFDGDETPLRNQRFADTYNEAVRAARQAGELDRGTSNDLLNAFRRAYTTN